MKLFLFSLLYLLPVISPSPHALTSTLTISPTRSHLPQTHPHPHLLPLPYPYPHPHPPLYTVTGTASRYFPFGTGEGIVGTTVGTASRAFPYVNYTLSKTLNYPTTTITRQSFSTVTVRNRSVGWDSLGTVGTGVWIGNGVGTVQPTTTAKAALTARDVAFVPIAAVPVKPQPGPPEAESVREPAPLSTIMTTVFYDAGAMKNQVLGKEMEPVTRTETRTRTLLPPAVEEPVPEEDPQSHSHAPAQAPRQVLKQAPSQPPAGGSGDTSEDRSRRSWSWGWGDGRRQQGGLGGGFLKGLCDMLMDGIDGLEGVTGRWKEREDEGRDVNGEE